jgi:hypothetical protein
MFVLRLLVQLPLYAADAVTALGAARLAMGVPLFGLTVWLSWLVLRGVPTATPAGQQDGAQAVAADDLADDEQRVR